MPIQRIVCFQFNAQATQADKLQHMQDFAAMQPAIPQILAYRGGFTCPGDYNRPPDFDTMHYLTFASMADVDIYFHHEAHQRFIERNKAAWANVLVLNSEY